MVGNKKVIGVCMTQIHNTSRSRLISNLYNKSNEKGYKLIVFDSSFDFYVGLDDDINASGVYDYINFEIVDALIILCSCFLDKKVYEKVVARALSKKIPVILEDEELEGCITVKNEYDDVYFDMMNHVINHHGRRDTFFISGRKDNEQSQHREEIYKKVLKANNLPFSEDMIDYGKFWGVHTFVVMDRLREQRAKMPDAIFCANDAMATAVCKKLAEFGYRVPEDVVVTGFDGAMISFFTKPTLTTCMLNTEGFIDLCIGIISSAFEKEKTESLYINNYRVRYSESCGCNEEVTTDLRQMVEEYYYLSRNMISHETGVLNKMMVQLNMTEMGHNSFYSVISSITHETALLALRPSFLSRFLHPDANSDVDDNELVVIASDEADAKNVAKQGKITYKDMIPQKEEWAEDGSMYVITSVQVGRVNCGYYMDRIYDVIQETQKTNRVKNLINIVIHLALSDVRQRYLKANSGEETSIDTITELFNLRGVTYWYEKFVELPQSKTKYFTVSIYELPKYKYIYENFGVGEVDAAVCFVAEALRMANPKDCTIAHISEDSFIVVNYYADKADAEHNRNRATSLFYSVLNNYNYVSGKDYYLEVNTGCTGLVHGHHHKLELLIKSATNEMYKNKATHGATNVSKSTITTSKEQYDLFNVLLANNLFKYHFQPIVSAKDGEVYAYEALMRTDESIGMNPLEVLSVASEYNRLYDIEKATLFNVMERFSKEQKTFYGRKVFVNCIPGHFLNSEDNARLTELYSPLIDNFVFEIIEQDTLDESELTTLRSIGNHNGNNPIALDDYGVGHSNIVNLINYEPDIVKIDRFLLTDIDVDETKQLVVGSIIDFARMRGIKVLAEGVESEQELRKVIEMGVDFIQGYFTGRPVKEPVETIDEDVRRIIVEANKRI